MKIIQLAYVEESTFSDGFLAGKLNPGARVKWVTHEPCHQDWYVIYLGEWDEDIAQTAIAKHLLAEGLIS
jgi:hypothetical protein